MISLREIAEQSKIEFYAGWEDHTPSESGVVESLIALNLMGQTDEAIIEIIGDEAGNYFGRYGKSSQEFLGLLAKATQKMSLDLSHLQDKIEERVRYEEKVSILEWRVKEASLERVEQLFAALLVELLPQFLALGLSEEDLIERLASLPDYLIGLIDTTTLSKVLKS